MRALSFALFVSLVVPAGLVHAAQEETRLSPVSSQEQNLAAPAGAKTVYVNDFELDVSKTKDEKKEEKASTAPRGEAKQPKKEETPADTAKAFIDAMSSTLVKELQKAGYAAHRLRSGDTRPGDGIGIHGVFAVSDDQNRLRRATVGNEPIVGKLQLFVGISNLSHPDQALYAIADPKTGDDKQGPIISVSAYAPVVKFEIPRDVNEKTVGDTAAAIVANLTVLLNANVAALTH
jgi:Domain of unknown function (DUF4410)